ncbi:Mg2+ transporter protein CorA-like/Zinc transport protein ZntB [Penicillium manginii]|uniref:Mg2+ transporter protein CorA-like/Zinc transport protein ZntB n=1 Tax=Penicillium manginii TaxID=203109 RepID=UPI0025495207|nr:Mg2+ transporter protein CorA-like/Zinc transport protein ZntB [Penicillium manginii]KAJ5734611.1 Mg2+ transporter protein CorA-like/Zinc transport protein ZntB [Penicillium manginii]
MLETIVEVHGIDPSFWELPSCFYQRDDDFEDVFCVPYTMLRKGSIIEISYTLRYPEYKASGEWTTRQTGIYHQLDVSNSRNLFIIFNPTPRSKVHCEVERVLRDQSMLIKSEPFWLHQTLFSLYSPSWRDYIRSLERRFLPIANTAFATFIDEPLRLNYDNLSALSNLEIRFLQISTIVESTTETIDGLCQLFDELSRPNSEAQNLRNICRKCLVSSRTATNLKNRVQIMARLLSDTLLLRDQMVANQQNTNMFQLNKSAVFITTLTLLYLPASFMATFFGMNFFDLDQEKNRIVGSPTIWIFIVASTVLTAITFLFYYWLLHRDGTVFRKLMPKVPDLKIQTLRRQWTNLTQGDVELQRLSC